MGPGLFLVFNSGGENVKLWKRPDSDVWYVEYRDINNKRIKRSTHVTDKRAAESLGRQWEREGSNPDQVIRNKVTLGDALTALIQDREELAQTGERSSATVLFYKERADQLERALGKTTLLAEVTAREIDRFISQRRDNRVSSNTIHKELVTLRCALKIAKRRRLWAGDLDVLMPEDFSANYKPRDRSLTLEELDKLLAVLPKHRGAQVAFIVATSARFGESVQARSEDVIEGFVTLRGTKTEGSLRTVPIVTDWQRRLIEFAVKHAGDKAPAYRREATLEEQGRLFRRWEGVNQHLRNACTKAGLGKCSPNDLRRTTLTLLWKQGAAPDLVAKVAGHVDTTMVNRVYIQHDPQSLAQRLMAALNPPAPPVPPSPRSRALRAPRMSGTRVDRQRARNPWESRALDKMKTGTGMGQREVDKTRRESDNLSSSVGVPDFESGSFDHSDSSPPLDIDGDQGVGKEDPAAPLGDLEIGTHAGQVSED